MFVYNCQERAITLPRERIRVSTPLSESSNKILCNSWRSQLSTTLINSLKADGQMELKKMFMNRISDCLCFCFTSEVSGITKSRAIGLLSKPPYPRERAQSIRPLFYRTFIIVHRWHFCGARNTEIIEALNKRILRFILDDFESSYNNLLDKVNCVSLYNRRTHNMLILLYKSYF